MKKRKKVTVPTTPKCYFCPIMGPPESKPLSKHAEEMNKGILRARRLHARQQKKLSSVRGRKG